MTPKYPYNEALPAGLTNVTQSVQPLRMDQITKIFFQRAQAASPFANLTAIQTKASWDALVAAAGATKVVYTPTFSGMTIPASARATQGGNDNSTINGIPEYYNEQAIVGVEGMFRNLDQASMDSLDLLTQFSLANGVGTSNLRMWLVSKDGYIFCKSNFQGFTCYNFATGTRGNLGLNNADVIPFRMDLEPGWSKGLICVKTSFDPIVDFTA